jgi:DNA recombination protein RmuC
MMESLLPVLIVSAVLVVLLVIGLLLSRRVSAARPPADQILREELRLSRDEGSREARSLREEVARSQKDASESVVNVLSKLGDQQAQRLGDVVAALTRLETSHLKASETLRDRVDGQLRQIQETNERKLEQMRQTVDEKLHNTLEKRLGESFKLVSERLEAVQRGLGEMQKLATGVGDLKRVLTNVKERGTWGEYQLAAILEQVLTPDQYEAKFHPKPGAEQVEFAVRLPGPKDGSGEPVWLPIDSKFPKEDYERLVEASQQGDAEGVRKATAGLIAVVEKCAKDIHDKYLNPPRTTDFALLFLPTEGLYAEVLRQPGIHDRLQQKYHVVPTGPTTLSAILNSLRIGFHTLAIEKRSSEVWQVLAAVKTEFGKFGEVLDKVQKQLGAASNTLEQTAVRTRVMERKLRQVEQLPADLRGTVLELPPGGMPREEDGEEESASPGL